MGFFNDPANQPAAGQTTSGQLPTGALNATLSSLGLTPTQAAGGNTSGGTTSGGSTPAAGGAMPTITNPNDPTQVSAYFQWLATQPNTDPILQTPGGVQYYTQKALESGGLTSTDYWQHKATLASAGGAVGAPGAVGGGAGTPGGLWNSVPTEQQAMNMPGIQFGIDEAARQYQAGAAAKGTLLNGRVQQALGESLVGTALNQGYIPLAQLQLGVNQANTGNLYNLANLGLSGVQTGNA